MKKFLFILLSLFLVLSIFSCNTNPIKHTNSSADSTDNIRSDDNPSDDKPSDDKPVDDKPTDDTPTDVPPTDDTSTKYNVVFKIYDKDSSSYIDYDTKEISKLSDLNDDIKVDDVIIGETTYSFYGWADVASSDEIIEEFQVAKVDENTPLTSDKTLCAIYTPDYLTFTAVENTDISFDVIGSAELQNPISLQYKKVEDGVFKDYTWDSNKTEVNTEAIGEKITLFPGEKIYFKGNNITFSSYSNVYYKTTYVQFQSTGKVKASGNIMSIMSNKTEVSKYCFTNFFKDCTTLLSAPSLSAIILATCCYQGMFYGCTSLTTAPELPATTLAESCYKSMFEGCISLKKTLKKLIATRLYSYCYSYMFYGCTSLVQPPELPAKSIAQGCYYSMFEGCTSLEIAPELAAETLALGCYMRMFVDCKSLTSSPVLPATTLEQRCYREMFYGCSSLSNVTCLATDINAKDCTYHWNENVLSSGTFYCKEGVDWTKVDYGIPVGWTVVYV